MGTHKKEGTVLKIKEVTSHMELNVLVKGSKLILLSAFILVNEQLKKNQWN